MRNCAAMLDKVNTRCYNKCMPKKDGVMKTYSFNNKTIEQMKYLSEVLFLKPTSLIEFLINKAYNESKQVERK